MDVKNNIKEIVLDVTKWPDIVAKLGFPIVAVLILLSILWYGLIAPARESQKILIASITDAAAASTGTNKELLKIQSIMGSSMTAIEHSLQRQEVLSEYVRDMSQKHLETLIANGELIQANGELIKLNNLVLKQNGELISHNSELLDEAKLMMDPVGKDRQKTVEILERILVKLAEQSGDRHE